MYKLAGFCQLLSEITVLVVHLLEMSHIILLVEVDVETRFLRLNLFIHEVLNFYQEWLEHSEEGFSHLFDKIFLGCLIDQRIGC